MSPAGDVQELNPNVDQGNRDRPTGDVVFWTASHDAELFTEAAVDLTTVASTAMPPRGPSEPADEPKPPRSEALEVGEVAGGEGAAA